MRRTLIIIVAVVVAIAGLAARPWSAKAAVGHTATCAFTSYTLTGSFNRVGGTAAFNLFATGSCVGTSTAVTVNIDFTSVGPWSCDGGTALGGGVITANNGPNQLVNATLANTAGEYVVEVHALNATFAAGQFTTLPIACDLGQTQTTIGGTGTLTFTA